MTLQRQINKLVLYHIIYSFPGVESASSTRPISWPWSLSPTVGSSSFSASAGSTTTFTTAWLRLLTSEPGKEMAVFNFDRPENNIPLKCFITVFVVVDNHGF